MKAFFKVIQPNNFVKNNLIFKYEVKPKINFFKNNVLPLFNKMNHQEQINFIENTSFLNNLFLLFYEEKSHILFRNNENIKLKHYAREIKNHKYKMVNNIKIMVTIENIIKNESILFKTKFK